MAIIQYTAAVNQVRGKLNGSQFNKSRTVNTLQRKAQQSRGVRGQQSSVRARFSDIQRNWSLLSPAQQLNWQLSADNNPVRDRFGDLVVISGYNMFMRANLQRSILQYPIIQDAYVMPAPSAPFTVAGGSVSVEFDVQGSLVFTVISFTVSGSFDDADFLYYVQLSLPVSNGVTVYHGRWQSAGSVEYQSGVIDVDGQIRGRYPLAPAGTRVFAKISAVHLASGVVVNEQVFPAVVTYA